MRKIKYISFILVVCFIAIVFTNKSPASAASLDLYGFENIYGYKNISFGANHYSDGDEVDNMYINYLTNLNMDNQEKTELYLLLNDPYGIDDEEFYINFVITDMNGNIVPYSKSNNEYTFSIRYDNDEGIIIDSNHNIKLSNMNKKVSNSYSYSYIDTTTSDADDGVYDYTVDFLGNLYMLDFDDFEKDYFILSEVKAVFSTDGTHPYLDDFWGGNLANFYNYSDISFEILVADYFISNPMKLTNVYADDDSIKVLWENVPINVAFKGVYIVDKNGRNFYEVQNKRNGKKVELTVLNLSLSEIGDNNYALQTYVYDNNGSEFSIASSNNVTYTTRDIYYQCYAITYAMREIRSGFLNIPYTAGSSIYFKMRDCAGTVIKNAVDFSYGYVYDTPGKIAVRSITTSDVVKSNASNSAFAFAHSKMDLEEPMVFELKLDIYRKVDVFLNSDNAFLDRFSETLKLTANANSYVYFDYCILTPDKIHREADDSLNYNLVAVTYFNKAGELTKGSYYPEAMYVDSNGVVRNGFGEEKVGYVFDGYNIINNSGNVVEPNNSHLEAEIELADEALKGIAKDTAEDVANDENNPLGWFINFIKDLFGKLGQAGKIILGIIGCVIGVCFISIIVWFIKKIYRMFKK